MSSLYRLTADYQNLLDALLDSADADTGEVDVDIAAQLEKAQGAFEDKAVAIATVSRALTTKSDEIDAEIKRLQSMKKRMDAENERVRRYLTDACEAAGILKIRGVSASISFRKSEQTIIDDADILPREFCTEKVTYTPNKTAIKAAIFAGRIVPGAHVETCNNIQIK